MRLLSLDDQHYLRWDIFPDDKIPPYAILSHTWGTDEVTYADLTGGQAQNRLGYSKITFCGEQAVECDGLKYFWVDSCCINKESSAELSEAIISMFKWYERATKCYVYLSDVSASGHDVEQHTDWWIEPFRASRWFTRGWTLQELLAPACVEFFSAERQRLGDKSSLALLIHDITKIPLAAVRGQALETINLEERRKWIEGRETAKPEDLAYCQLGIFGVWMAAGYGEGGDSARRRLHDEIDKLPYTGMNLPKLLTIGPLGVPGLPFCVERESRLHSLSTRVPDHYYTTQENDNYALEEGYKLERVECFVWNRRHLGTFPIYQYFNTGNGDHFYTQDAGEGHRAKEVEYVFEKVAFYTSQLGVAREGSHMLCLHRLRLHVEHFYTTDEQERNGLLQVSFTAEGNIGFVFPQKTEQTVPLYRWYKG